MDEKTLRERIVNCAYEMFSSRGVRSVTMDAISAELCISKRTLYEEYGSKMELLETVLFEMNKYYQTRNDLISATDKGAIEKIFMITSLQNEHNGKQTMFFQDIVSNYPQLLEKLIKANYEVNISRIKKNIEQGCREGYFYEDIDFNLVIDFFIGYKVHSHFSKTLPRVEMMRNYSYGTILFLRSIATVKGIEEIDRLCKINNINIYKLKV